MCRKATELVQSMLGFCNIDLDFFLYHTVVAVVVHWSKATKRILELFNRQVPLSHRAVELAEFQEGRRLLHSKARVHFQPLPVDFFAAFVLFQCFSQFSECPADQVK